MIDRYQTRTGHFISFWDVPTEIYRRNPIDASNLAIVQFGPRGPRNSWRHATNGMSEHVQRCNQGPVRTELFASTDERRDWAIALLEAVARYPMQQNTFIGEYDTVAVGQPIDSAQSPFTAILLAPPGRSEHAAVGTIEAGMADVIPVYRVIGIFTDECQLTIERGGRNLYNQLLQQVCTLSFDEARSSVV